MSPKVNSRGRNEYSIQERTTTDEYAKLEQDP